ncbi:MAG TPA: hypothetical protein ENN76_00945, partial [Euryarchaeota archaeon]|nr:hypothetical protein [Euryarchaeota archaeon]
MHLTVSLHNNDGLGPKYDHNFKLSGVVYSHLKKHNTEEAGAIHDSHKRSAFVLSEIHPVSKKTGESWFRMGTSSDYVLKMAGKAFAPSTKITVGAVEYQVTGLTIEEPVVRPGEFVTLSPILLKDKKTNQSIVHDTPGYKDTLEMAINAQIKNYMKVEGTVRVIHFEPQAVRNRTIKGRTVLAQKGRMLLDGEEEQLRFLVNHGIGRSPALGFGMVVRV